MKSISIFLTFALILTSAPLGAFSPSQKQPVSPLHLSKFSVSNSSEDLQALSMIRGKPGEQGNGEGAVQVTPSQKFLAVFLTDPEGEFKQSTAVRLSLVGPSGRPCVSSPVPPSDPKAEFRLKAYINNLNKAAGIQGLKDPEQILERISKAQKTNPVPPAVMTDIQSYSKRYQALKNFAVVVPHQGSANMNVAFVLNPTPGVWKLHVGGGDRQGFYACLAAGESQRAISESRELWSKALEGFAPKEELRHGPAVSSSDSDALASKFTCGLCQFMVIFAEGWLMAGMVFGLATIIITTFGVGTLIAVAIVSVLVGLLAAGAIASSSIPRAVCRKVGLCR